MTRRRHAATTSSTPTGNWASRRTEIKTILGRGTLKLPATTTPPSPRESSFRAQTATFTSRTRMAMWYSMNPHPMKRWSQKCTTSPTRCHVRHALVRGERLIQRHQIREPWNSWAMSPAEESVNFTWPLPTIQPYQTSPK